MTWRREIKDTLDASMEMPEQYGSRAYWRYQHVSALIGIVVLPIALLLNVIEVPAKLEGVAGASLVLFMIAVAVYFVRRDRTVQKRIDETGSPIVDREPY